MVETVTRKQTATATVELAINFQNKMSLIAVRFGLNERDDLNAVQNLSGGSEYNFQRVPPFRSQPVSPIAGAVVRLAARIILRYFC